MKKRKFRILWILNFVLNFGLEKAPSLAEGVGGGSSNRHCETCERKSWQSTIIF